MTRSRVSSREIRSNPRKLPPLRVLSSCGRFSRSRADVSRAAAGSLSMPRCCIFLTPRGIWTKKTKMLTSTPPFLPRSQDRDPHGDHREPPGEDPGGYYGQRALHGHQEVEGWQGWVRVLPVGAVACHSPPHLRKSRPGPKIDTSTTFFFTPVIGSDNGGFTRYGFAVAKKCGRLFSTVQTPTDANTSQQGDSVFWGDRFFSCLFYTAADLIHDRVPSLSSDRAKGCSACASGRTTKSSPSSSRDTRMPSRR